MIVEHAQRPAVRTPDGCVVLELDRQWHSLRYRRGPEPSCARFEDSLTLLHDMLMTLAASGELANATSLDLGRDYTAFYRRLAIAAARSKAWDAQRGKPVTGNANAFVVATAADPATFFPEVVTLLQDTGLRAELRSVEKVLAGTPSDTPFAAELLAAGATPKAKLPHDCIVAFHLEPSK